jgi:hypothetical protein
MVNIYAEPMNKSSQKLLKDHFEIEYNILDCPHL